MQTTEMKDHEPQLKLLNIFEGNWKVEGKNFPITPNGVEDWVQGEDRYSWLPGNFFLFSYWEHMIEIGGHQGMSVMGFDEAEKKLFARNYDNLGYERVYLLEASGGNWKFTGPQERAVRNFSEDGKSFEENWELLNGAGTWIPLCYRKGVKIEEVPSP